ncbi:hypothetical protein J7412_17050 [Shimia sp. R9_3]|nr:hypothetical protein [Shimia sp. R9_3]
MVTFSVAKVHAQEKLVFGVRVDAPPFSYHEAVSEYLSDSSMPGAPRAHGFKGYMVDVCSSVIEALQNEGRIDTPVSTRVVNAGNRFDLLRDGEVHILCDPAAILQERL